jgi:hypothetical protein
LLACIPAWAQTPSAPAKGETILHPSDLQNLIPASVYFSGQVATTQLRNSAALRSPDGKLTIFVMVDASGYSAALRQRYQLYILTDTALLIGNKRLPAGAYGAGFLQDTGFLVMDLGGADLLHAPMLHDAAMRRPRPLQVTPGSSPNEFRLYVGRDYIAFHRAPR